MVTQITPGSIGHLGNASIGQPYDSAWRSVWRDGDLGMERRGGGQETLPSFEGDLADLAGRRSPDRVLSDLKT